MTKVAIIHGFGEGQATSKQFRAQLQQAGLEFHKNPTEADVIIAHSGGCCLVPAAHSAKLVVLVGPVHWPGKSLSAAVKQKVGQEYRLYRQQGKLGTWIKKSALNLCYATNVQRNIRMHKALKSGDVWKVIAPTVVIIRNQNDTFCVRDLNGELFSQTPALLSMVGEHDDCWFFPQAYVNIVQSYYERVLAKTSRG